MSNHAQRLRDEVIEPMKQRFVGRDEAIELIALAAVAGEHLFLFGPPGTAKSALVRAFSDSVGAASFEAMLTRFSEPNEIFGPVDINALRDGKLQTITDGMLPRAEIAFLDEIFNANSAILNHLLTVLNERVWRRGAEVHRLPLLSLFSASNGLPEDETLRALFDRFLLRCRLQNLGRDQTASLLESGRALEVASALQSSVTSDDLRALRDGIARVSLDDVREDLIETGWKIRDFGVDLSDRRLVKMQRLVAASALLNGRDAARRADLWVFRYVWDREEQIEPLRSLVDKLIANDDAPDTHPMARARDGVDAESLAKQISEAESELDAGRLNLSAVARLRERLSAVADDSAWVGDAQQRDHLVTRARALLERLDA